MKIKEKIKARQSRKPIPVEKLILLLAASFAAYNFGLAGGYIEGTKFSVGGLAAGIVVNVSIAIAASRFGALKGDKRIRQASYAFVGMLFLSPVLVSPVIFYSLPPSFLGIWELRAAWSVAWPLVADLAIVLAGAVSGKGLIALSDAGASQSVASAKSSRESASKKSDNAKSPADSIAVKRTYPRKCEHCTEILRSANAVGGHMKKHHPQLCKPTRAGVHQQGSEAPLVVGLFAQVKSEKVENRQ